MSSDEREQGSIKNRGLPGRLKSRLRACGPRSPAKPDWGSRPSPAWPDFVAAAPGRGFNRPVPGPRFLIEPREQARIPGDLSPCADTTSEGDVVADLLAELHARHYRPSAWTRFIARSCSIAQQTANAHPRLVRSWLRVAVGLTLAEAIALGVEARIGGKAGRSAAGRAAPGVALCLAYTLGDAYAHLGMNHQARGEPLDETLGLPTVLTLTRSATAGLLFGRLLGRAPASKGVLALALTTAALTDIADGQIARRTHRTTRLGAYLDSVADFGFTLALTLTLAARRALPRWLVAALLGRWLAPFACAVFAYVGLGYRAPIGSTTLGKVAGVAQAATLGVALLPARAQRRAPGAQRALHALMAAFTVIAPLAQLVQFARARGRAQREEQQRRGQR